MIAPDLVTPPPLPRYTPLTRSEYLEQFHAPWSYSQSAAIDFDATAHKVKRFRPDPQREESLCAVELSLKDWGGDYSKRRAIEKKTARYIREKVVPAGLLLDADQIAERLEGCRNKGILGVVNGSDRKVVRWAEKCGLVKLCPDEARAEQKRLARRYVPACAAWLKESPRRRFQYAVFEPVNVPIGNLKQGMREAYAALVRLLRHKSFKAIKGCFAAMEAPLSRDGQSWNVHINCLFLVEGGFDWGRVRQEYGNRIHFESTQSIIDKTRRYLQRRNGGSPVELSRADVLTCAFREIIKYSSKHVSESSESGKTDAPGITQWPPELFVEWYAAHKGLRRCRSYGALYNAPEQEREPLEVTWIGTMDYSQRGGYRIAINKRPAVISLQGDKSTKNHAANRRQNSLFQSGAPPGG